MSTQIRMTDILKFIVFFCDCTFQTHFRQRMSLYGYQNARSCVRLCVLFHTDSIEKCFRKEAVYFSVLWHDFFTASRFEGSFVCS
jgi:hypothetical protein